MDEDLLAVLAHAWMNTMAVIVGAAGTLLDFGPRLNASQRVELLEMLRTQSSYLQVEIHDTLLNKSMAATGAIA